MDTQPEETNKGEDNAKFLEAIDAQAKDEILLSIARHYGVSSSRMFEEVTDESAEHLLDYMIEPYRSAAFVLMVRHGYMEMPGLQT